MSLKLINSHKDKQLSSLSITFEITVSVQRFREGQICDNFVLVKFNCLRSFGHLCIFAN